MNHLKKHGKFIAILIVLIGLLWFADGEIGLMSQSVDNKQKQAQNLLKRNLNKLFTDAKASNGEPATVANRRIQDETQGTQQTSRQRNNRISFDTSPIYTLASLEDKAATEGVGYYRERQMALLSKFQYLRFVTIPDLRDESAFGLSEPDPMTQSVVEDFLRKMDIIECVAESAGRSDIKRLERFQFPTGIMDKFSISGIPSKPMGGDTKPFVSGIALEVTVEATEKALYNFMIDLQNPNKAGRPNRYLAVWEFTFEKPDLLNPVDDFISATIVVVALTVDESSGFPFDEEAKNTRMNNNRNSGRSFR